MSFTIGMALDLTVVALLVATIAYALRLSKRLGELRNSRGELQAVIQEFNLACGRMQMALAGASTTVSEQAHLIDSRVEQARQLQSDLQYLLDAGEALATRLEADYSAQRQAARAPAPSNAGLRPIATATLPAVAEPARKPFRAEPVTGTAPAAATAVARAPLTVDEAGVPTAESLRASGRPTRPAGEATGDRTAADDLLRAIRNLR